MPGRILKLLLVIMLSGWIQMVQAQKLNAFPKRTDPLHVKVTKLDRLMRANHWNEGTIIQKVIFPPAGLDRPVIGQHADCLDKTAEMLMAYTYKYAITLNPKDRKLANQLFEGLEKLERITGVPGLIARSFYKTNKPLWHEQALWYPLEWHWSTSIPGYRWLGDLSADKFTSLFYSVGTYWELCADEAYRNVPPTYSTGFSGAASTTISS